MGAAAREGSIERGSFSKTDRQVVTLTNPDLRERIPAGIAGREPRIGPTTATTRGQGSGQAIEPVVRIGRKGSLNSLRRPAQARGVGGLGRDDALEQNLLRTTKRRTRHRLDVGEVEDGRQARRGPRPRRRVGQGTKGRTGPRRGDAQAAPVR